MSDRVEAAIRELADALREELRSEISAPAPERLHDVRSAAAAMGIGRTLLLDLISAGHVRSIRAGRRRLVPQSAIDDFTRRGGAVT